MPLSYGVHLPRTSTAGISSYTGQGARLEFRVESERRQIFIDWPTFHDGRGIRAEIELSYPADHESMTVVIPIGERRFYYNHKVNCLPAQGTLRYGDIQEELRPEEMLASLDWGRGVGLNLARTNLGITFSQVHQMFGRFTGEVWADDGECIHLEGLIGFAEEHHARW